MLQIEKPILTDEVRKDWIDYNGHMNDSAYAIIFSLAADQLINGLGIDAGFRRNYCFSIYTLETHICYLDEAHEGQKLFVHMQLLDYDAKRMHVFFTLKSGEDKLLATSEQMLIGMNMNEKRSAPFPAPIHSRLKILAKMHANLPKPEEAGRIIKIRRR